MKPNSAGIGEETTYSDWCAVSQRRLRRNAEVKIIR
jgi:hypothetical protein